MVLFLFRTNSLAIHNEIINFCAEEFKEQWVLIIFRYFGKSEIDDGLADVIIPLSKSKCERIIYIFDEIFSELSLDEGKSITFGFGLLRFLFLMWRSRHINYLLFLRWCGSIRLLRMNNFFDWGASIVVYFFMISFPSFHASTTLYDISFSS